MNALEQEVAKRGLPERTKLALWDAATGYKVRNNTYRTAAEISHGLASKDLMALAGSGLLVPVGERKGRHYVASTRLREIRRDAAENRFIPNPYEEGAATGPRPPSEQPDGDPPPEDP
jgi:hypothetical protein